MKSSSEFERALGSHLELLAAIPATAVLGYDNKYIDTAPTHCKVTKANIVHDHMIESADRTLPEPTFRRVESKGRILYNYNETAILQFNKIESSMRRSSGNETLQAIEFEELGEAGLEGIPAALPLITIGYVLKPGNPGLDGIYAVRILKSGPQWVLRLDDENEGEGNVSQLPIPHDPQNTHQQHKRIKRPVREQDKDRDGTNQS